MDRLNKEHRHRGFCALAEAICARLNHNQLDSANQINMSGDGLHMKYINRHNEAVLELDSEEMEATFYRAFCRHQEDSSLLLDMVAMLKFCGFKITEPAF